MSNKKALICYSNPAGTGRLRLDIEHSKLEAAIRESGFDLSFIHRMHAVRLKDLINELTSSSYEILQFSGHGSTEGIYLENGEYSAPELVGIESIKQILTLPSIKLRILILTCCYSDSYREEISNLVPYLITVDGQAEDEAAIDFSKNFFTLLLCDVPVEFAIRATELENKNLKVKLYRRGLIKQKNDVKVEAIDRNGLKVILDLNPIRQEMLKLSPIESEHFLSSICTTLRAHFKLFVEALERVPIPFGKYIGLFSWQNEIDPIVCEKYFTISSAITEEQLGAFFILSNSYTRLAGLHYRKKIERIFPGMENSINSALKEYYVLKSILSGKDCIALQDLIPDQYKVLKSIINANLIEADYAFGRQDFSKCIVTMEIMLTTIHNFLIQLSSVLENKENS